MWIPEEFLLKNNAKIIPHKQLPKDALDAIVFQKKFIDQFTFISFSNGLIEVHLDTYCLATWDGKSWK